MEFAKIAEGGIGEGKGWSVPKWQGQANGEETLVLDISKGPILQEGLRDGKPLRPPNRQ